MPLPAAVRARAASPLRAQRRNTSEMSRSPLRRGRAVCCRALQDPPTLGRERERAADGQCACADHSAAVRPLVRTVHAWLRLRQSPDPLPEGSELRATAVAPARWNPAPRRKKALKPAGLARFRSLWGTVRAATGKVGRVVEPHGADCF